MNEIMTDLMACRDLADSIEAEMQLLQMAMEQLDRPFNLQIRERVYLLLYHSQFFVSPELQQLQIRTKRVSDGLVSTERGLQL